MKSSNSSFSPVRRVLVAAAVVLATGNFAVYAQTESGSGSSSSQGSSNTGSSYNSSTPSSSDSSSANMSSSDMSSSQSSSGSKSDKLSWGDRRFVTKAAEDGQAEVQLAQLATEKASNPDVKNFAQQMVEQHQQVNSQLMSIASSKNVKIDQDDATKDRTYKKLSKASGNDFDREFVEHMVDEHEKDIKMYEKAANSAKDPEVRQFASSTLQHLRQHLSQVQQLQQSVVPTGRMDNDSGRSGMSGSSSTSTSTTSSSGMSGSSGSSYGSGSSGSSGSSYGSGSSGSSGMSGSSSTTGASGSGSSTSSPTTR